MGGTGEMSWTDPAKDAGGTFRNLASGGAGGNYAFLGSVQNRVAHDKRWRFDLFKAICGKRSRSPERFTL